MLAPAAKRHVSVALMILIIILTDDKLSEKVTERDQTKQEE